MGIGIILGGGFFEPRTRVTVVLCNAFAFVVEDTEVVLGSGITLSGSLFIPRTRLGVVLRDALAVGVEDAEVALRFGIAFFSEGLPFFQCGGVVLLFVSLCGGGHQRFFFAITQGIGGACGEKEGKAEGDFYGLVPFYWGIFCKSLLRGLLDFFVIRLCGGFFEPRAGFVDVLRYTLAVVVEGAEVK